MVFGNFGFPSPPNPLLPAMKYFGYAEVIRGERGKKDFREGKMDSVGGNCSSGVGTIFPTGKGVRDGIA